MRIVCSKCEPISRCFVGNCKHVDALLEASRNALGAMTSQRYGKPKVGFEHHHAELEKALKGLEDERAAS